MRIAPFAVLVLCGCYINTPITSVAPDPGAKLHITLTGTGSDQLAQYLGPAVVAVDGRFLDQTDSTISLSATQTDLRSGDNQFWNGERITLPKRYITEVEQKKFSVWRSSALASAFVAGIAAIAGVAGGLGSNSAKPGSGTGGAK